MGREGSSGKERTPPHWLPSSSHLVIGVRVPSCGAVVLALSGGMAAADEGGRVWLGRKVSGSASEPAGTLPCSGAETAPPFGSAETWPLKRYGRFVSPGAPPCGAGASASWKVRPGLCAGCPRWSCTRRHCPDSRQPQYLPPDARVSAPSCGAPPRLPRTLTPCPSLSGSPSLLYTSVCAL